MPKNYDDQPNNEFLPLPADRELVGTLSAHGRRALELLPRALETGTDAVCYDFLTRLLAQMVMADRPEMVVREAARIANIASNPGIELTFQETGKMQLPVVENVPLFIANGDGGTPSPFLDEDGRQLVADKILMKLGSGKITGVIVGSSRAQLAGWIVRAPRELFVKTDLKSEELKSGVILERVWSDMPYNDLLRLGYWTPDFPRVKAAFDHLLAQGKVREEDFFDMSDIFTTLSDAFAKVFSTRQLAATPTDEFFTLAKKLQVPIDRKTFVYTRPK